MKFSRTSVPALAELVFLAFDDRGVRDRDAQRMLEQRGDREPVGHRADHAGLGGGPDIADPAGAPLDCAHVQTRKTTVAPKEAERDDLHSPQTAAALGVGNGVGPANDSAKLARGADGMRLPTSGLCATPPSSATPGPARPASPSEQDRPYYQGELRNGLRR